MNSCHEMRARIHARGDRGLALEAMLELQLHLEQCQRCRALSERVRSIDEALSVLPVPPLAANDVERNVRAVRAAIDERTWSVPIRPRRIPWIVLALPLAAAAALILWLGWPHAPAKLPVSATESGIVAQSEPGPRFEPAPPPPEIAAPPASPPLSLSPSSPTESDSDPFDPARLARAREDVRVCLREASALLVDPNGASSAEEFAAHFDDAVRELARSGWPIARLVEPLANDSDTMLACAALRWLGAHGEHIASRTAKNSLARPELKAALCQALLDQGERGLEGLAPALRDDVLRPRVLASLRQRHDAASVAFLERALRSKALDDASSGLPAVLDVLADNGAEGVAALLRLASTHALSEDAALAALARSAGASAGLAELVDALPRGIDNGLVLRAARRLHSQECLAWLAERCTDPRTERGLRREALDTISAIGGPDALAALLALRSLGRMDPGEVDGALSRALARSSMAAEELVRRLSHQAHDADLRALFEASTLETDAALVPTWLALAYSDRLSNADRRTLLLLIGEHGSPADAAGVVGILTLLHTSDKDLRAAAFVALHALGDANALRSGLANLPPRVSASVQALLYSTDARDKPTALLLRLARALDNPNSPRL